MKKKTEKNQVFKYFIAVCVAISAFIIYFLINRPQKLVLEVVDQDQQMLEFTYNISEQNPPFEDIIKRSGDGHHVILVLLTKKLRRMQNTDYQTLIDGYKNCGEKLPCAIYKMHRDEYLKLAKKRKDIKE